MNSRQRGTVGSTKIRWNWHRLMEVQYVDCDLCMFGQKVWENEQELETSDTESANITSVSCWTCDVMVKHTYAPEK